MSQVALNAVFKHSRAVGADWAVMLTLAHLSDESGAVDINVTALAEAARVRRETAQRCVKALVQDGELDRKQGGFLIVYCSESVTTDHTPCVTTDHSVTDDHTECDERSHIEPESVTTDHTPCDRGSHPSRTHVVISSPSETTSPSEDNLSDPTDLQGEPPSPLDLAFEAYQQSAVRAGWSKAQKFSDKRKSKLKQRLKDAGGLEGWTAALTRAERSSFLCGQNDRGFTADFDFLLQETSFTRLLEGRYDDKPPQGLNAINGAKTNGKRSGYQQALEEFLGGAEQGLASGDASAVEILPPENQPGFALGLGNRIR